MTLEEEFLEFIRRSYLILPHPESKQFRQLRFAFFAGALVAATMDNKQRDAELRAFALSLRREYRVN